MDEIDKAIEELIPLLSIPGKSLTKSAALETLLAFTGSDDGCEIFKHHEPLKTLIAKTAINSCEDQEAICKSLQILTNLSAASGDQCDWFLTSGPAELCHNLWHLATNGEVNRRTRTEASAVLCNLTRDSPLASIVWKKLQQSTEGSLLQKLVDLACQDDGETYLASTLANFSQLDDVRKQLTEKESGYIPRLLPFVNHQKIQIRKRRGFASAIRNCCFEYDQHNYLLDEDLELLPRLLLPLAGPEEFDEEDNEELPLDLQYLPPEKTREPEPDIRRILIEAIHQLCVTTDGRNVVKSRRGTYLIMRELHKWEKDPNVIVALENLVDVLIGDEIGEDYRKVSVPADLKEKFASMDAQHVKDAESKESENSSSLSNVAGKFLVNKI